MLSITTCPRKNVSSVPSKYHVGSLSSLWIPSPIYHHNRQHQLNLMQWCLRILLISCASWCRMRLKLKFIMPMRMMWSGCMKISIYSLKVIRIGMWLTPANCTISAIEWKGEYQSGWGHWPNNTSISIWIKISKGQTGEFDHSLKKWCSMQPSMLKYCPMSISECLVRVAHNPNKDSLRLSATNITWRAEGQEIDWLTRTKLNKRKQMTNDGKCVFSIFNYHKFNFEDYYYRCRWLIKNIININIYIYF